MKPMIDEFTKYGDLSYKTELPEEQKQLFEDFYETFEKTVDAYVEVNADKIGTPSRPLMENVLDNRILETYNFARNIDKAKRDQFDPVSVDDTYDKLD